MTKRMNLLPCPFCGGRDYHVEYHGQTITDGQHYFIVCDNCGASGPTCKREELQKRWNERI